MSQSKASAKAPGKAAVKAKPAATKRKPAPAVVAETLRIIEAPAPHHAPVAHLNPAEQARTTQALALAADIERAVRDGKETVVLGPEAVQALLSALCKIYSAHIEHAQPYDAFSPLSPVTPTDVMVTASGLLKAANLAVFELGMWQSWTGR